MTAPTSPVLDFYNRPPKELAGLFKKSITNGGPIQAPSRPTSGESITLYAPPAGRGLLLREQPAAVTNYWQVSVVKYDASSFNAARIVVNVHRAGASGARARLYYSTTGQAGSFVDAGIDLSGNTLPLTCKIDALGVRDGSGPIATGARTDVYFTVMWDNGDGTTSPVIGAVFLQFMVKTFRACVWTPVVSSAQMLGSGQSVLSDPNWTVTGDTGIFSSGCTGTSCLASVARFRFGSGAPINGIATRVFTAGDFPQLSPGKVARLNGEMSWSYLFRTCPSLNADIRLTVSVQGVEMTTVPSGFPPYDFNWLPFTVEMPVDGSGITVSVGVFGESGICSVSVVGGFRLFNIEVLDDGNGGTDCIAP